MAIAKKRKAEGRIVDSDAESSENGRDETPLFVDSDLPKKRLCSILKNLPQVPESQYLLQSERNIGIHIELHREIAASIMVSTRTKAVLIGSGENAKYFDVWTSLTNLHSKYFQDNVFPPTPVEASTSIMLVTNPITLSESIAFNRSAQTIKRGKDNSTQQLLNITTREDPTSSSTTVAKANDASEIGHDISLLRATRPVEFGCFIAWMIEGTITCGSISRTAHVLKLPLPALEELWFFAEKLGSPSFQNRVMQCILSRKLMTSSKWPSHKEVNYIESMSRPSEPCPLYDLAVVCVAINKPFQTLKDDSEEYKVWDKMLDNKSRIIKASLKEVSTKWSKSNRPWSEGNVRRWLVDEPLLSRAYENWILGPRKLSRETLIEKSTSRLQKLSSTMG